MQCTLGGPGSASAIAAPSILTYVFSMTPERFICPIRLAMNRTLTFRLVLGRQITLIRHINPAIMSLGRGDSLLHTIMTSTADLEISLSSKGTDWPLDKAKIRRGVDRDVSLPVSGAFMPVYSLRQRCLGIVLFAILSPATENQFRKGGGRPFRAFSSYKMR